MLRDAYPISDWMYSWIQKWVHRPIMSQPTDKGKGRIASILGLEATLHRSSTFYINCHWLIKQLKNAHFEHLVGQAENPFHVQDAHYWRDWLAPMGIQIANLFFQLIVRYFEKASTVLASVKAFS